MRERLQRSEADHSGDTGIRVYTRIGQLYSILYELRHLVDDPPVLVVSTEIAEAITDLSGSLIEAMGDVKNAAFDATFPPKIKSRRRTGYNLFALQKWLKAAETKAWTERSARVAEVNRKRGDRHV